MRDYLRKQSRQAATGVPEVVIPTQLDKPSQYAGRFKLNTWTHKTTTKALARRALENTQKEASKKARDPELAIFNSKYRPKQPEKRTTINWTLTSLDPFDSLVVSIKPRSQKLLAHCKFKL